MARAVQYEYAHPSRCPMLHSTALAVREYRAPSSTRSSRVSSAIVPSKPSSYRQTISQVNAARTPEEKNIILTSAFQPSPNRPIKRDAYAAFPDSPDGAWATLSFHPLKRARQAPAAPTKSKKFTIPLLTAPTSKAHPAPPAGRRRPAYRPPPRQGNASRVSVSTTSSAPASGSRSGAASVSGPYAAGSGTRDEEPRLFDPVVTVYTPLSPVSSPARPASSRRECFARNSLPSPPPSDPAPEAGVPSVRYEPLKIRYAGMKRRIAEVRASLGVVVHVSSAC